MRVACCNATASPEASQLPYKPRDHAALRCTTKDLITKGVCGAAVLQYRLRNPGLGRLGHLVARTLLGLSQKRSMHPALV